ncbi:hypothetical protein CUMW_009990 [Citrus unshiu]|nr:hypothetical protein CUMW_009990 [Citrus unshiu]
MESGKILQNPRPSPSPSLAFTNNNKAMPNELAQKPSTPIIDKFRALLKLREEEARVGDGAGTTLSTDEIVQLYETVLAELTFNSKPIITDLTIIAGEQRAHGDGIAEAICTRILEVFCEAYRQVHPDLHSAMQHLFGTWSTVFPQAVLHKIEAELQFSSQVNKQSSNVNSLRASESPRPTHGIHVNPKYIRQFEHSNTDSVGGQRSNPAGSVGRATFALGANKLHPSSTSRLGRSLSPLGIGSEGDEFAVENSPRRLEGTSPSHPVFDYGIGRAIGRNEEVSEWHNPNRFESTSTSYNLSNGHEHQGPRALIDAYGSDRRASNNKPPQVGHMGINGMGNKVASRSWQNTEEEEFDWEDMSPTLLDRGRKNDFLPSSVPLYGSTGARPDFSKLNASSLESDIRTNHSSQAQLPLLDDSSVTAEDSVSLLGSGRGTGKVSGFQSEPNQNLGSRYPQESWNLPHHFSRSSHPPNGRGRGRDSHIPFPGSGVPSLGVDKAAPYIDKFVGADALFVRPPAVVSRIGSSGPDLLSTGAIQSSTGAWAPMNLHKPHLPPGQPVYPQQKQTRTQFDSINAAGSILNQGLSKSLYNSESKELSLMKPQLHDQHATPNQQNQGRAQFLSQEATNKFLPSIAASMPPHLLAPPLSHGYTQRGHNAVMGMVPSNPVPAGQQPLHVQSIQNSSLHLQGRPSPPLPPGPPPASSQMIPGSQSAGLVVPSQQPGHAFSGLISSLMAQGLISLTTQTPVQDSVGLEFNADLHKLRHESAISSLYANLPRQCTTCGLRFKCQEEHSSHMDWHVTKNRMSKNRKQKPSRKWFVSASMWLSGTEALGTDAIPGFLPAEPILEKKDDEEMAVPADEDQNVCALCGEPFDDFYSDETEEWMYKGAVYMNAPNGSTEGMDRSQLGPIVHAKCRSESTVIPSDDFKRDEGGSSEEVVIRQLQCVLFVDHQLLIINEMVKILATPTSKANEPDIFMILMVACVA